MNIAATIALAAASAVPAAAGPALADPAAIDAEVARFTGAAAGEPGGAARPVDRRLRLQACTAGLRIEWNSARRDTLEVRCADPGGWRLYVPVMFAMSGGAGAAIATAIPSVARGEPVSLSAAGAGFAVSRPAEALESGAIGEWIRVRPLTERGLAQEPVRARIVRPGLVSVPIG